TGGLLHGFWLFEDLELRLQDSCFLSTDSWQKVLVTSGFQNVEALGLPFQETHHRHSVIVCAKERVVGERLQSIPAKTDQGRTVMIEEVVREIIGPQRTEALVPERPLMEAGLDSMELMELRLLLGKKFGIELDATFLFQHNTLQKVSAFFQQDDALVQAQRQL